MSSFIHISGVEKSYDELSVLRGITFSCKKGEVIGMLGASGSGKSTLLRIIAGLQDVDSGSIKVGKQKVTGPKYNLVPGYKNIRLVHQDFHLSPNLSVRDNIRDELLDYTDDYQEERLQELLELCRLAEKADHLPRELSGGQQQRVAIASALAHEPELVLMDEPFSNLDYGLKNTIRDEIVAIIKSTGASMIMVSHDPHDAMAVADTILILHEGKIIQKGKPFELYHTPKNKYVASFLGPINELNDGSLIRPEGFQIDHQGKNQGIVSNSYFQGRTFHLLIESNISDKPILIYSKQQLLPGSKVKFSFTSHDL